MVRRTGRQSSGGRRPGAWPTCLRSQACLPSGRRRDGAALPPASILTALRHAILGAGGVGGLVGGGLAHSGNDVLLLLTERSFAEYPGALRVESAVLGDFEVAVAAATRLDRPVDVRWVTVKATDRSEG